jgi:signal transduction histidine kinase
MQKHPSAARILPVAAIAATLGVFGAIAALQSRWIAQLSQAELEGAKIRLQISLRAVQADINHEVNRAWVLFQWEAGLPPQSLGERTKEAYAAWRKNAQFPGLIRRMLVVRPDDGTGDLRMARVDPVTGLYSPVVWPEELKDLRRQIVLPFKDYQTFGVRTFSGITLAGAPLLVFPLAPGSNNGMPGSYPSAGAWFLIELDQQLLLTRIVPESIRENLEQPDQFDYRISSEEFPSRVVYQSNPKAAFAAADAACSLLEMRRDFLRNEKGVRGQPMRFPFGESAEEKQAMARLHRFHYARVDLPGAPPAPANEGGVWRLEVRHRAGSLEAAAARVRRSNLILAFAMIALAAANLSILGLAARRAHRLAEARLQFAAGVSHELRTPLAAICAAADNLAAGVAHEPSKVRQYGAAILNQGRQLTSMVEQILGFTGGQLGKKRYESEALDLTDIVRRSVAAVDPAAREAGIAIDVETQQELPPVLGDAEALQQALVNLINNAIRYGADGGWIGVSAREGDAGRLEVRVCDRGAGIPARELRRIFEPFYRGANSRGPERRGSGLGLTIVEQIARAHGGRVSVESEPGCGSCFTLHLPALVYAATNSHSGR